MPDIRVLVVDDEPSVRALLATFLKGADYEVLEAEDGVQAVERAHQSRPHIVLLDVTMPKMDGLEACRRIKADPDLTGVQVVVCTARAARQDLMEAIRAGADDYITKPFTREGILEKAARARARYETPRVAMAPDRRKMPRRASRWTVTWQSPACQASFKCKVLDISVTGLAFAFPGCKECTAGEHSALKTHWPEGRTLDLIIALNTDVLLDVRGTVVRASIMADGAAEQVGIRFDGLEPHAAAILQRFVSGELGNPPAS